MGGHGTGGILPSKSSQSGRTTGRAADGRAGERAGGRAGGRGRAGVMSALCLVVYLVVTHSQHR